VNTARATVPVLGTAATGSLHDLAVCGQLPDHQRMDHATLDWITSHPPKGPQPPSPLPRQRLLLPEPKWFATPEGPAGLHGILHNARVSLLTGLLCEQHGLDHRTTMTLRAAAAVHDCRRLTDRDDPDHGQRAAVWFLKHHDAVGAQAGITSSAGAAVRAATALQLHATDHERFTIAERRAYQRTALWADLLKTADALDRFRLPLARWWPDLTRLRIAPATWMAPLAHQLVIRSERALLDGATHHQALAHSL